MSEDPEETRLTLVALGIVGGLITIGVVYWMSGRYPF